jgi:predicted PurR-regulated permease PerM
MDLEKGPGGGSEPAGRPEWLIRGADWSWRLLAIAAAAAVGAWVVVRLRVVFLPLAFALLLSTVLVPPQRWLRRRGLRPLPATWVVFLVGLGAVAGMAFWLIPAIVSQASGLGDLIRHASDRIQQWLVEGPLGLSTGTAQSFFDKLRSELSANSGALLKGALRGTVLAVEAVAGMLLTAVFTFFIVKDGEEVFRTAAGLADEENRSRVLEMGRRAWTVLSGYVLGATVNGLVNGTLMGITLVVTGVPLVLPLAFATFLGAYVPVAGALISGGLAALVALAANGWATALVVVGATIVIHHVEAYLVGPVVLGRAISLRPAAVVAALAVGGALAGIPGAMLAVPIAAVLTALLELQREASTDHATA